MPGESAAVLVCGGRDYADRDYLYQYLDQLRQEVSLRRLIHGNARGADSLAAQWAQDRSIPTRAFPADWKKYGKSAGFRRNEQMLREGKPDLVVGFPGGKGTGHMLQLARQAGVTVQEVVLTK